MAKHRQPSEMHRRQRSKNLAMLAVLAGLVVLFYLITIVQMGTRG
jgi:fatty acid desaturase